METQPKALPEQQPGPQRPRLLGKRSLLREIVETLLLIIAIYTLVNLATARFMVEGRSMVPSFQGNEYLIVSRFDYQLGEPQRGDVVVFHYPNDPDRDFIKRVVGLPGEQVRLQQGQVLINGVPLQEPYIAALCSKPSCEDAVWLLEQDQYFVLGDNRNASQDSSSFGPIGREYLIGRAWIKYWPPSEWGIIRHHDYAVEIPAEAPPLPSPTPTITVPPMFDSTG